MCVAFSSGDNAYYGSNVWRTWRRLRQRCWCWWCLVHLSRHPRLSLAISA